MLHTLWLSVASLHLAGRPGARLGSPHCVGWPQAVLEMDTACAEQIPEADMVLGFQNYSSLPRHLRGMLGLSPAMDEAAHSQRSQVYRLCKSVEAVLLCIAHAMC